MSFKYITIKIIILCCIYLYNFLITNEINMSPPARLYVKNEFPELNDAPNNDAPRQRTVQLLSQLALYFLSADRRIQHQEIYANRR